MRALLFLLAFVLTPGAFAQGNLLGDIPLSTSAPTFSSQSHSLSPTGLWDNTASPLPTNAWWQNLVLGGGGLTVNTLPYLVQVDNSALRFGFPGKVVSQNYILTTFTDNLNFGAVGGLPARQITDYGPLHVRVDWGSGTGSMHANLVRGQPYMTAHYNGLTPRVGTVHAIIGLNGGSASGSVTGTKFVMQLNNGQTWIVYASSTVTMSVSGGALVASGSFTGTLRAALSQGGDEAVLDAHAGRIPVGGEVSATATGDMGELVFDWETEGSGPLLMLALPHHMDVLSSPTTPGLVRNTLKGDMTGISGLAWTMEEPLTTIGFESPNGIEPALEQDVRNALAQDIGFAVTAPDPYFGGKQFSALARLALIADELGETTLANGYRNALGSALEERLAGQNGDPLLYDSLWTGLLQRPPFPLWLLDLCRGRYGQGQSGVGVSMGR